MPRLIHRHPSPGCAGKTVTVEYTDAEYAALPYGNSTRALLDGGFPVRQGAATLVDLVAFYHRRMRIEAEALQALTAAVA